MRIDPFEYAKDAAGVCGLILFIGGLLFLAGGFA